MFFNPIRGVVLDLVPIQLQGTVDCQMCCAMNCITYGILGR